MSAVEMIDYFALALGHGLMAIAFLHLFWRDGLDVDPLLQSFKDAEADNRKQMSVAGRNAKRRQATIEPDDAATIADEQPH